VRFLVIEKLGSYLALSALRISRAAYHRIELISYSFSFLSPSLKYRIVVMGVMCIGRSHASSHSTICCTTPTTNDEVSLSVSSDGISSRLTISSTGPFIIRFKVSAPHPLYRLCRQISTVGPTPSARPRQFLPLSKHNRGPRLNRAAWSFFIYPSFVLHFSFVALERLRVTFLDTLQAI
jgi:hypothetical protein